MDNCQIRYRIIEIVYICHLDLNNLKNHVLLRFLLIILIAYFNINLHSYGQLLSLFFCMRLYDISIQMEFHQNRFINECARNIVGKIP